MKKYQKTETAKQTELNPLDLFDNHFNRSYRNLSKDYDNFGWISLKDYAHFRKNSQDPIRLKVLNYFTHQEFIINFQEINFNDQADLFLMDPTV